MKNRFTKPGFKKRITESVNMSVLLFVAIILLFIMGISFIAGTSGKGQKDILTEAINKDVVHCYAIEGYYPPNLAYIEDHYGLTYDRSKYTIDYQSIGNNIYPDVTVLEKNR